MSRKIDSFSIMLLGDTSVGKTSLVYSFLKEPTPSPSPTPTIGYDVKLKTINIRDKSVKLKIFDTSGQERYSAMTKNYLRNSHGFILVFDLTSLKTLDLLSKWINSINNIMSDVPFILVGNKSDLKKAIDAVDIEQFKERYNLLYFETSAVTSINVDEAFMKISDLVYQHLLTNPSLKNTVSIIFDQPKSQSKCC